jgi:hypothetical protein
MNCDSTEIIPKEQIIRVLNHIPLDFNGVKTEGLETESRTEECKLRTQSQNEIKDLIKLCLDNKVGLNFQDFLEVTNKISSDIFLSVCEI